MISTASLRDRELDLLLPTDDSLLLSVACDFGSSERMRLTA